MKFKTLISLLGRWLIYSVHSFFTVLQFTFVVFNREGEYIRVHKRSPIIRQVINTQVIFSGIDALFPTLFLSFLIGMSVTAELILFLQQFTNEKETFSLLTKFIALQLSPILVAFVLVSRSGSAITVDLGNMRINHEIKGLVFLGVDPYIYLAYPRFMGLLISQIALAIYFSVLTMLFGVLFACLLSSLSHFKYFIFLLFDSFNITELGLYLIKNGIYGVTIAAYACFFGLNVKKSVTEIPQATQKTIVNSLITILLINTLFSLF